MIPLAFGQLSPSACTCAITSCRSSRSYFSAAFISASVMPPGRFTTARSSSTCSLLTGSPISCCASATASQIRLHVLNLCRGDHSVSICLLALRVARGLVYVSYADGSLITHDWSPRALFLAAGPSHCGSRPCSTGICRRYASAGGQSGWPKPSYGPS